MADALAVLPTTHLTLRAEKELLAAGVFPRMVVKPRRLASDCGLALQFPRGEISRARAALAAAGLYPVFYLRAGEAWEQAG
jgi:hypothetical protein